MAAGVSKESTIVRSVFIIYFAVGLAFYIYHKFIRPAIQRRNMYKVKDVIKESNNMWTINLVPQNGNITSYKPGQFGFLKIFSNNIKAEEHPFSISSSLSNNQYISFTIKELGDYTSNIGKVEVGSLACIDGPYGKFSYLEYPEEKYTVLIAGGVGITPMLSMLRYMNDRDTDRNVILLWGVNTSNDLICKNEIKSIEKQMKNLHIVPVMAKENSWQGEKGYINSQLIQKVLSDYRYDINTTGFYICGPGPMAEGIVKGLKTIQVKRKNIHFEKFSM
jgi:predicted ferric reductase